MESSEEIVFREIQKNDIAAVFELLKSISDFAPQKNEHDKIWDKFCNQKNVFSLVAVFGGKIIGYGSIIIEIKVRGGKMGHIEDIVTDPNLRKKGVGKLIIDNLFHIAKREGCYKLALQCSQDNESFYTKCGFERSGITMQRFI